MGYSCGRIEEGEGSVMNWLKDAIVELCTRLFNYVFRGSKSSDSAPKDEDDKKFQDKIKKEGW